MWHALRAELAYFRPYLLGGLGMAGGVVVILTVVFTAVGKDGPPSHAAAAIRGIFPIMAPLIVCFIMQALRTEERRARLLLSGPLTPRQLGGVTVLLPTVMLGVGILGAGVVIGVEALVTGRLAFESVQIVGFVGGQIYVYAMLGLVVQEAVAAHSQQRLSAAAAGWTGFGVAVVLLAGLYLALTLQILTWNHLLIGHLIVAALAGFASMALYTGRVDFTH